MGDWEQCSECGRNGPRDEMTEVGCDDDGCGGIEGIYICDQCREMAEIDNYIMDEIANEERSDGGSADGRCAR